LTPSLHQGEERQEPSHLWQKDPRMHEHWHFCHRQEKEKDWGYQKEDVESPLSENEENEVMFRIEYYEYCWGYSSFCESGRIIDIG
jgi:hypothetical protein